ncbi:MAG: hypothetical protein ABIH41_03225 [Nanoarchaeota archaeon]
MVNVQLLHPQEIEVYYLIPTIRKHFTLLLKQRGLAQKDVAKILAIRESTVSQYVQHKRGDHITFPKQVIDELEKSVQTITTTADYLRETQRILRLIRSTDLICRIHKAHAQLPPCCNGSDKPCTVELSWN